MNITDDLMSKAHEAWEIETERWILERSSVGGTARYKIPMDGAALDSPIDAEAVIHRFDTWGAAVTFKRDKIIRAILAVLP